MQDSMYVFGGSKFPLEEITNELWSLNLLTLTWTYHGPFPNPDVGSGSVTNTSAGNITGVGVAGGDDVVSVEEGASGRSCLPIPVRSHTAHVVGTKMVVIFGLSSGEENAVSFVQEYDFGEFGVLPACFTPYYICYLPLTASHGLAFHNA